VNNFATIELVQKYRKVTYYTISINEETTLFQQFINKHTNSNYDKLYHIIRWIEVIGDKIGALDQYFRNEAEIADTRALPPKGVDREPIYVEIDDATEEEHNKPNNLRLYCFKANESVVFLFNGDIKTSRRAQDCDSVRPHFKVANTLSKLIEEAFINKDIRWNKSYTDIIVDEHFLLKWE